MSLLTNLVSYYKFDENTGTTIGDALSTDNLTWNGTLGSQWTTGKINSGGNFNGTDNYAVNPNVLWSTNTAAWSMGGWFKSNDYTTSNQTIISNGDGGGSFRGYALVLSGNGTTDGSMYLLNHQIAWGNLGFKVQDNNWHHIIFTVSADGNTNKCYLDGVLRFTGGNASLGTPSGSSFIGSVSTGIYFFKGVLDEMVYWTRELSSAEDTSLYNGGSGLQYPFPSFIGTIISQPIFERDEVVGY